MRIYIVLFLCISSLSSFGQIQENQQLKTQFSFQETKTYENKPELLSVEEISGFSFNPIRNKAVVDFSFIIPSIKKYKSIYIEQGDTLHGFTACMTIDLKEERITSDTFVKIFLYPTAYSITKIYRVKCITVDGTIRFYPFFKELHQGDLEKMTASKQAYQRELKEKKEREDAIIKEWERNKDKPQDESWRNAKAEIISGGTQPESNSTISEKIEEAKVSLQLQLERLKEMENDIKVKMEELNKLKENP